MPSHLFTPIQLRELTLKNRVIISPLCQYSAVDGTASPWHQQHIGSFSISGAGLCILEATGVSAVGRISPQCLGLYSDENEAALTKLLKDARTYSDMPMGIQLDHAGRKASTRPTWDLFKGHMVPDAEGGWTPEGPSPEAFTEGWRQPHELDAAGLKRVRDEFVEATRRADRCGFDMIEIHAAHGYLLHEFCSPLTNHRKDAYGGDLKGRLRFPLEIAQAMRDAFPKGKPIGVRITGEDWVEGGLNLDDAVVFAKALKEIGMDYVTPSAGNVAPGMKLPKVGPGYMVHFAEKVKREAGITTMTVGMIYDPHHAEDIVASGKADMVAIGRAIMDNPRWPWHAATALGERIDTPKQYARSSPQHWPAYAAVHGVTLREGEGVMGHATRE
jgi:2,4-dienoyl-CoA reductase-like NADH-dependent reductase (Old Yellow Enzyme family)